MLIKFSFTAGGGKDDVKIAYNEVGGIGETVAIWAQGGKKKRPRRSRMYRWV